MNGLTRKEAIQVLWAQIKAAENKDYKYSHIAQAMKRDNGKWVLVTRKGNRYEVDASDRRDHAKGKYRQDGIIILGKEKGDKVKDC